METCQLAWRKWRLDKKCEIPKECIPTVSSTKAELQPHISDLNLYPRVPTAQSVSVWGVVPGLHCDFSLCFEEHRAVPWSVVSVHPAILYNTF